jgi:hypothetical protein
LEKGSAYCQSEEGYEKGERVGLVEFDPLERGELTPEQNKDMAKRMERMSTMMHEAGRVAKADE